MISIRGYEGSEIMNSNKKTSKTIDFDATKRQRSSKNNPPAYFNPYSKNSEYNPPSYYNPTRNLNPLNDNRKTAQPKSPELRRKQMKEQNKLSKSQIRKNHKRRKRHFVIKVSAIMLSTVLVIWGGISLKDTLIYPKISYQIVQAGKIDNSMAFEGLIIRDEKVYYGEDKGDLQYIIGEGEKVRKNGAVCALVNDSALAQTQEEKDKTSTEIYNAADTRKAFSYYQDDVYQIDHEINNTINKFYSERMKESTEYVYAIRNQLERSMDRRTEVYVEEQEDLNNSAAKKIMALDSKMNTLKYISKAEESGIVSYKIDGQESYFTSEMIDQIQYTMFKEIQASTTQPAMSSSADTKEMPLYKIVTADSWYIVSYVEAEAGENFRPEQSYQLFFETMDNRGINFKLKAKKAEDERVKLVFETNEQIDDFLGERTIVFSIGNKNEEGLKVPLQAVVEQNMIRIPTEYKVQQGEDIGVYRKNGEVAEFVKLNIQYEKDDAIYVFQEIGQLESIQINDLLVHKESGKETKIEQMETRQGVYVINGKIAQFKAIEIHLQNNEYALIKENSQSELKALDKIISNPKSIKRDQLLQHMNIQNE
ncbi:MAG: hypothetical protein K0S30_1051 [Clostridia bacterium]|jgi:hypothetical protein|nr:hypothetical protein [Clostridia bacterium]